MTKKLKIEYEINLSIYEDWCQVILTDENIKQLKKYLSGDAVTYTIRDYINDNFGNPIE